MGNKGNKGNKGSKGSKGNKGTQASDFAEEIYAKCNELGREVCVNQDPIDGGPEASIAPYLKIGGVVILGVPSVRDTFSVANAPSTEIEALEAAVIAGFRSDPSSPQRAPRVLTKYTRDRLGCTWDDEEPSHRSAARDLLFSSRPDTCPIKRLGWRCFSSLQAATAWAQKQPGMDPTEAPKSWRSPVQPLLEEGKDFEVASVKLKVSDVSVACHHVQGDVELGTDTYACHHGVFDAPELDMLWLKKTRWYEAKTPSGQAFGISCHFYEQELTPGAEKVWVGTICHMLRDGTAFQSTAAMPEVPNPSLCEA